MGKKLKVAFMDYPLEPDKPGRSGLSDVIWDMAKALIDQGHEAHVVGCYHTDSFPDPRVIVHDFPEPPIGYRNIVGQMWLLNRAGNIIKQIEPDIVHAPEYVATALFSMKKLNCPIVLTVPGNIFQRIEAGHGFDWSFVEVLKWAARRTAKTCDAILCISQEMKLWWERTGSHPQKTPWIPYGIDTKRFYPVADARHRLGISEDENLLLYVGRFSPEKGILELLDALAQQPDLLNQPFKLVLIGKGALESEIRHHIGHLELENQVSIMPWVAQDDLKLWYSAANVLLMPSWNEPLGKVFLEAMACGTPVIASDTEGPKDHVQIGKTGFLFPVHDVPALSNMLRIAIMQPETLTQMKDASLAYVENNLTWSQIMRCIVNDVYLPLINKEPLQAIDWRRDEVAA
ncbi:MAG: glycosyltransferase family 4 protein [Chloroflexota bacterium]